VVSDDEPRAVRIPRTRGVPLSPTQERFWSWIRSAPPDDPNFIMGLARDLRGTLDPRLLSRVLDQLARRHESLRTVFRLKDGQPLQVVQPAMHAPLRLVDLSTRRESERESAALEEVAAEFRRPFDLSHGPLLRATLLRLAGDRHVIVLVIHHIVADGWSLDVLWRGVGEVLAGPRDMQLPRLPLQYADFAGWSRRRRFSDALASERDYWSQQLDGAPRILALPTDFPRPANPTLEGDGRWGLAQSSDCAGLIAGHLSLVAFRGTHPSGAVMPGSQTGSLSEPTSVDHLTARQDLCDPNRYRGATGLRQSARLIGNRPGLPSRARSRSSEHTGSRSTAASWTDGFRRGCCPGSPGTYACVTVLLSPNRVPRGGLVGRCSSAATPTRWCGFMAAEQQTCVCLLATNGIHNRVADRDRSPLGVERLPFGCRGDDDMPLVRVKTDRDLIGGEEQVGQVGPPHGRLQI
jgi:hypothetical protein